MKQALNCIKALLLVIMFTSAETIFSNKQPSMPMSYGGMGSFGANNPFGGFGGGAGDNDPFASQNFDMNNIDAAAMMEDLLNMDGGDEILKQACEMTEKATGVKINLDELRDGIKALSSNPEEKDKFNNAYKENLKSIQAQAQDPDALSKIQESFEKHLEDPDNFFGDFDDGNLDELFDKKQSPKEEKTPEKKPERISNVKNWHELFVNKQDAMSEADIKLYASDLGSFSGYVNKLLTSEKVRDIFAQLNETGSMLNNLCISLAHFESPASINILFDQKQKGLRAELSEAIKKISSFLEDVEAANYKQSVTNDDLFNSSIDDLMQRTKKKKSLDPIIVTKLKEIQTLTKKCIDELKVLIEQSVSVKKKIAKAASVLSVSGKGGKYSWPTSYSKNHSNDLNRKNKYGNKYYDRGWDDGNYYDDYGYNSGINQDKPNNPKDQNAPNNEKKGDEKKETKEPAGKDSETLDKFLRSELLTNLVKNENTLKRNDEEASIKATELFLETDFANLKQVVEKIVKDLGDDNKNKTASLQKLESLFNIAQRLTHVPCELEFDTPFKTAGYLRNAAPDVDKAFLIFEQDPSQESFSKIIEKIKAKTPLLEKQEASLKDLLSHHAFTQFFDKKEGIDKEFYSAKEKANERSISQIKNTFNEIIGIVKSQNFESLSSNGKFADKFKDLAKLIANVTLNYPLIDTIFKDKELVEDSKSIHKEAIKIYEQLINGMFARGNTNLVTFKFHKIFGTFDGALKILGLEKQAEESSTNIEQIIKVFVIINNLFKSNLWDAEKTKNILSKYADWPALFSDFQLMLNFDKIAAELDAVRCEKLWSNTRSLKFKAELPLYLSSYCQGNAFSQNNTEHYQLAFNAYDFFSNQENLKKASWEYFDSEEFSNLLIKEIIKVRHANILGNKEELYSDVAIFSLIKTHQFISNFNQKESYLAQDLSFIFSNKNFYEKNGLITEACALLEHTIQQICKKSSILKNKSSILSEAGKILRYIVFGLIFKSTVNTALLKQEAENACSSLEQKTTLAPNFNEIKKILILECFAKKFPMIHTTIKKEKKVETKVVVPVIEKLLFGKTPPIKISSIINDEKSSSLKFMMSLYKNDIMTLILNHKDRVSMNNSFDALAGVWNYLSKLDEFEIYLSDNIAQETDSVIMKAIFNIKESFAGDIGFIKDMNLTGKIKIEVIKNISFITGKLAETYKEDLVEFARKKDLLNEIASSFALLLDDMVKEKVTIAPKRTEPQDGDNKSENLLKNLLQMVK